MEPRLYHQAQSRMTLITVRGGKSHFSLLISAATILRCSIYQCPPVCLPVLPPYGEKRQLFVDAELTSLSRNVMWTMWNWCTACVMPCTVHVVVCLQADLLDQIHIWHTIAVNGQDDWSRLPWHILPRWMALQSGNRELICHDVTAHVKKLNYSTTTTILWPVHRTTCVNCDHQLGTGGFCWS